MPTRMAADLFGGPKVVRDVVLEGVRSAMPSEMAPYLLGQLADIHRPKDVEKILNGNPESLTPEIAFALLACLGIPLDRVLKTPQYLDARERAEWQEDMKQRGCGPVAATGMSFNINEAADCYVRIRAVRDLGSA